MNAILNHIIRSVFPLNNQQFVPNHSFSIDQSHIRFCNGVYFKKVVDLKAGDGFGELALISAENTRTATVVCLTECLFATLAKADFDLSIKKIEEKRLQKIKKFLHQVPCFRYMRNSDIQKFTYCIQILKFKHGKTVYQENDPVQGCYLVYKGAFLVSKKLQKVNKQDKNSIYHFLAD